MKKFIFLITITTQFLFAQNNQIKDYKNSHQFNEMNNLNETTKTKDYSFYKAVYLNVTNKPEASLKQQLSKNNKHLKNTFDYTRLLNDNAIKAFDYQLANETSKQLITTFAKDFNQKDLNDEINNQRIWEVLINTPKQTFTPFKHTEIETKKDLAGLITLKAKHKDYASDFVFDTGAGLNCITETQAKNFGIKILPDNNIEVESFTGQKNKVKIGIAENISIGDITIKNSVFLVYPDEAFSFANGKYIINGIIGFPIAKELGTLTIEENKITVSKEKQEYKLPKNLFIDQLRPIVVINYKGEKLPCNFDSGAESSQFTKSFYEKFKSYIDDNSTNQQVKSTSAGAEVFEKEMKILTNEEIKIGNTTINLPEITVDKNDFGVYGKVNYGNIGQDVLKQFKKVTISFDDNFLLLEN